MKRLARLLAMLALAVPFSVPAICDAPPRGDGAGAEQDADKDKDKDKPSKKQKVEDIDDEEMATPVTHRGVRIAFDRRPTLLVGNWLRADFKIKLQTDFRAFDPDLSTVDGCGVFPNGNGCLFDMHRARIDLKGKLFTYLSFEVEREFKDTSRPLFLIQDFNHVRQEEVHDPWRDVYVDFRRFPKFSIQGGKFKIPFSLDQWSGDTDRDFVRRSRLGDLLGPDRDIGIMIHGRFLNKGLNYQLGLFKHDGNNSHLSGTVAEIYEDPATAERTIAGRITGTPLRLLRIPKVFKSIEFGGAFTTSPVPAGARGLRSRTTSDETIFPRMFVAGERRRLGAELDWEPGPFGVQGEYARVSEERIGQALTGGNLPNLLTHAWYMSGTWLVTGEKKKKLEPQRAFRSWLLWGGPGAVELAVRYELLRNSSADPVGRPSRGLRAANVLEQSNRVWTFGVNWYLNRWTKIQYNAYREWIEDSIRGPLPGTNLFWSHVLRIQFVM